MSIITDPATEPYPAAQWIRFGCHVTGNTSMVMYDWILLCSSQQPPLVVFTYENHTDVNRFDINIRSTPSSCLDTVMCNVMDRSGNSGQATWRTGQVTGTTRNSYMSSQGLIQGVDGVASHPAYLYMILWE